MLWGLLNAWAKDFNQKEVERLPGMGKVIGNYMEKRAQAVQVLQDTLFDLLKHDLSPDQIKKQIKSYSNLLS